MAKPNLFNSVQLQKPKRNVFDLTHDVKLSLDMGNLVPTLAMECVPGDKFTIGCESLLRFAPLVSPVMHRMDVFMHYFFVPNRLLWSGWEDFITGNATPAFPTLNFGGTFTVTPSSLPDYMGIPYPNAPFTETVSALPFAAYQCIYNEYYRDQNLVSEINFALSNGANVNAALVVLRKRAWEHDYFTSALPFAQKGSAVSLPLGNFNDVPIFAEGGATDTGVNIDGTTVPGGAPTSVSAILEDGTGLFPGQLYAKTSELAPTATTINDLRRAMRLQEWLERNARAGTRYTESILGHFGVRSSDARLQRPEYITGTKSPVVISEVLNTTGTEDLPQGNMAGHGISVTQGKYGSYFCEEHGYIIGIMSVRPKTAYQQGIPKHFLKTTSYLDYYWPEFAHIGEQEILNREIYAYQASPSGTFGYTPRYAEYKYLASRVAGDFRGNLSFWHVGRIFSSAPSLNQTFIECVPRTDIFAVTSGDDTLYAHVLHKIRAVRSMPKFGTPTF